MSSRGSPMSRLRWAVALCGAAIMALTGVASAAAAPAAGARLGGAVVASVYGRTYVLLGPSVFGVTVQQDPLTYHVVKLADGTVHGGGRYHYLDAGRANTLSGPVTLMARHGKPPP